MVAARFVPRLEPTDDAVGEVVFGHAGTEHKLVAWDNDDGLWILFRDATSGVTTYPGSRQLVTPAPSPDGEVWIDFNRAHNMPCAYPLRHLPAAPGQQHAAVRGRGRGEDPRPTGVTPSYRSATSFLIAADESAFPFRHARL